MQVLLSPEPILVSSFFLAGNYYIVLGSLVSSFSKEEIAFILAHEIGHLEHSLHACPYLDKTPSYKICLHVFLLGLLLGYLYPLLLIPLCTLFFFMVYRWQKREYEADSFACLVMGKEVAIRTLEKLQNMDGCGFSLTHPSYSWRIYSCKMRSGRG